MSNIPSPKETTYAGVTMKSRLEGYWAVFLDYHPLVTTWVYEGKTFQLLPERHRYTPDFLFHHGEWETYIEVKPIFPDANYLIQLLRIAKDYRILLAVGSFYKGEVPTIYNIQDLLQDCPVSVEELVFNYKTVEDAYLRWITKDVIPSGKKLIETPHIPMAAAVCPQVSSYRFDLPERRPDFRTGSSKDFKETVKRWQARDRRRKRREKSAKSKKKK